MSDIGFVMMKKEELQSKAAAKDRPVVSVSKLKLAATGAAAVIPGGLALAGCTLGEQHEIFKCTSFGDKIDARWLDSEMRELEITGESSGLRLTVTDVDLLSIEVLGKLEKDSSWEVLNWRSCSNYRCPFWDVVLRDGARLWEAVATFKKIYSKYLHSRPCNQTLRDEIERQK